jgi:hypothetical protein
MKGTSAINAGGKDRKQIRNIKTKDMTQIKKEDPMAREKYLHPSKEANHTILPSFEVLEQCRSGLTKRIKITSRHVDRQRLKDIRDEIDFLIDSL